MVIAAALWATDRSIRFTRWIYYGFGNYCTITPLPEGATKVVMTRNITAEPGSHAFLYIPAVRGFQTHPFTLVSNKPATFVIKARTGFTKALHELAIKSPESRHRAAMEGPYGNVPSTDNYVRTLLVGGGAGATYTLAMAMDWLRKNSAARSNKALSFVWVIRNRGMSPTAEYERSIV
jgi:predicted ferric reductase